MLKRVVICASVLALAACGYNASTPSEPPAAAPENTANGWTQTLYKASAIYTGDPDLPVARAVIVDTDGVITSVSADDMDAAANLETVDLGDAVMFPGFVDGHAHLRGIGERELSFDLTGTSSIADLKARLAEQVQTREPGEVIIGRGWIETGWPEGRMPLAADLDAVSSDNPVVLGRADGHALLANTAAMIDLGVIGGGDMPDPAGGKIERDADGAPTGIFIDRAMDLFFAGYADAAAIDAADALETGAALYASRGWTGVHNMSVQAEEASVMEALDKAGKLPIRLHNAFDPGNGGYSIANARQFETDTITNRAVKIYMDGALGSRGAQLLEPYSDRPETSGLSLMKQGDLSDMVDRAAASDVQLAMHAIGDQANRRLIEMAERMDPMVGGMSKLRWRIEHTQILDARDVKRMANSGLIASMQPSHAIGDLHFAPDRLGMERLAGAYAWRDLLDAGAIIVGGSDAPVEVGSPLIEFYAAVARKDLSGFSGEGWNPDQAVTREEALAMFTSAPAYAAFQEDMLGTIEVGKRADFTVFDRDLMTVPEADILNAKPVMTVVNGKIVWRAE